MSKHIFKPISKPIFKTDFEISTEQILKDPTKYGLTLSQARHYLKK